MKKLTFVPAVLLFAALFFAYGCDCDVQGGPTFANLNVCIQAPDGTFFGCVQLDSNAHGVFTPASGTNCGDYSVCGSVFCPY
jgi:hypothetical protein